MTRPKPYAICAVGITLAASLFCVLSTQGQGPTLDDKELRQLVAHDAKAIQTLLAKPKFDKKAQGKVKAAAVMIAAYAEFAGQKSDAAMGLRDRALELAKAADSAKADVARKLAADLTLDAKGAGGKAEAVDFTKHIDIATLMKQFAAERFGGFALEKALEDLVESKGPTDAKEAAEVARLANKLATLAALARDLRTDADEGAKTKKAWRELATQMQSTAQELAQTANTRKDAEVSKVANRLSQTCVKCHDVFRN
ncbi:MAG: cytochrome c [Planctomycetes bacterium]|nr:cytochrome c [Planctomycetota bacterium]